MSDTKRIIPVILCGGSGTRLWPLSRQSYPKQLLSLVSEKSLLQDTLLRIRSLESPIVICNEEYRFVIAEQLRQVGFQHAKIILEPVGKNTAPATAIAALQLPEDALMLVLPSDHVIKNETVFLAAVEKAKQLALKNYLVTFGIEPSRPETGYGYIKKGENFVVEAFVEKPNVTTAQEYILSGKYLWNSGMFLFQSKTYLQELEKNAKDIFDSCQAVSQSIKHDLDFYRMDEALLESCRSESIDYAVMEKAKNVAFVPLDADWSDVGSWDALWETSCLDADGNAISGDVHTVNVKNSYLYSESRMVAAIGIENHVIVETSDAVLVLHKDHCQDIKTLVTQFKALKREEISNHRLVYRPWGYYEILGNQKYFKVKKIHVNPGARLSLQMHHHRAEHWVVISGVASVTCGEKEFELHKNQSTYIPIATKHRLENKSNDPLEIIEVQTGHYLEEDDIVRLEDIYGRLKIEPIA